MKNKIEQIIVNHIDRKISLGEATTQILRLFAVNENWIESSNPPKPNTQCKAKTPAGTDEIGQAWFDGKKWWQWEQGSGVKFRLKDGWVTHYIPLFERTE